MHLDPQTTSEIKELTQSASTIAIISHRNPDADTIGSNLTLREVLENWGKKVVSLCADKVPAELKFLHKADDFRQELEFSSIDAVVCVDSGSTKQTVFLEKYPEILDGELPVINIDHHPSNNHYGMTNLVLPEAASTTLIVYELLNAWNEKISRNAATALMSGLYFDTGSFMHSNAFGEVYQAAGELLNLGAQIDLIAKNLFHQHSIEKLKTWGKILENVKQTEKNVVFSGITSDALIECGTDATDSSGAIDYLNMAKDNLFTAMLVDDNKGSIRGSLRTRNDNIDLSEIAAMLGGGGHKKASGFSIFGKLKKELVWTIEKD